MTSVRQRAGDNSTDKNLGPDQFPSTSTRGWCTPSSSNDGVVFLILRGSGGYHVLGGETSWSGQRQDKQWWQPGWEELVSTTQGAPSGPHHAAVSCRAVSLVGPSVRNMSSDPWYNWLAALVVQVST